MCYMSYEFKIDAINLGIFSYLPLMKIAFDSVFFSLLEIYCQYICATNFCCCFFFIFFFQCAIKFNSSFYFSHLLSQAINKALSCAVFYRIYNVVFLFFAKRYDEATKRMNNNNNNIECTTKNRSFQIPYNCLHVQVKVLWYDLLSRIKQYTPEKSKKPEAALLRRRSGVEIAIKKSARILKSWENRRRMCKNTECTWIVFKIHQSTCFFLLLL